MRRLETSPEFLDGRLDDPAVLAGNLADLRRVNRWFGGTSLSRRAVVTLVDGELGPVTLLDVGTGAADIPAALVDAWAAGGRTLEAVAVDRRAEVLRGAVEIDPSLAARPELRLEVADGTVLPYPDGAFDVGHASLVLHHLEPDAAVGFLGELRRVARRGIVVNDLDRAAVYWLGAWLLAHVATRNPYTRHDGPLSVRRAYRPREAGTLLREAGLRPIRILRGPFGHRWAIAAVPDTAR